MFERLQELLLDELGAAGQPDWSRISVDSFSLRAVRGIRWAQPGRIESSTRLGRHRWKAERSIAWLAGCRRLRIRYDRDSERFFAFALLACDRLCYNRLPGAATARLP
jgi:hypothetical protein